MTAWRVFCLICLACLSLCAEEPAPTAAGLPATVTKAIADVEAEMVKARQAYSAAAQKMADKLMTTLKREQESATRKGDLDQAVAIKERLASIQKGEIQARVEVVVRTDLLGQTDGVDLRRLLLEYRWSYDWGDGNKPATFLASGEFGEGRNGFENRWKFDGDILLVLNQGNDVHTRMRLDLKTMHFIQDDDLRKRNGNPASVFSMSIIGPAPMPGAKQGGR